ALSPDLDVVLADYNLPQFDAPRALQHLRECGFDVPFIVVSGTIGEETAVAMMRDGATDFLLKDRLGRLGEAVGAAMEGRRLRREAEQTATALRASEARFRALVQHAPDLIAVMQADGTVRYASPSVERILGVPADELIGTDGFAMLHEGDVQWMRSTVAATAAAPDGSATVEGRLQHRDGSWRWIEAITTNLLDEPSVGGIVVNAHDITDRKHFEEQLTHQAFHDALTGLPNRALFLARLDHAFERARRQGSTLAVLALNLDRLKAINDSLGHPTGDAVLREVAERLTRHVREADTLAYLGGDCFAILLEDVPDATEAVRVADRLLVQLQRPLQAEGRDLVVGATIGVALGSRPDPPADHLLRDATTALSEAKARRPGSYIVFDEGLHARAVARLGLEGELRGAIEREELRLHYQPIVDLANGRITAVEALVRWEHPKRGLLAPGAFLSLADEAGLTVPIGTWVLEEACRQLCEWQQSTPAPPVDGIHVNLAAAQLHQADFVGSVERVLEKTGLVPTALRMEITEQILVEDLRATARSLRALRDLGVRLAIDDFGVGYSSLGYLRELDADVLKIDRTFVRELGHDEASAKIVRAVSGLAHDFGMRVTAEGIETDEQWSAARTVGCDLGQGYRFARPVSAGDVEALLTQRAVGSRA
ncbi:MAG: hypothetical protein QOF73_2119, partial [Thermomicrobiales bacterium]|nr:hypothetical protein [Thermomicrobiales bacterium]